MSQVLLEETVLLCFSFNAPQGTNGDILDYVGGSSLSSEDEIPSAVSSNQLCGREKTLLEASHVVLLLLFGDFVVSCSSGEVVSVSFFHDGSSTANGIEVNLLNMMTYIERHMWVSQVSHDIHDTLNIKIQ